MSEEVTTKERHMLLNAREFLLDNGLLAEMNRQVMHPLGLTLWMTTTVNTEQNGDFAPTTLCALAVEDISKGAMKDMIFDSPLVGDKYAQLLKLVADRKEQMEQRRRLLGDVTENGIFDEVQARILYLKYELLMHPGAVPTEWCELNDTVKDTWLALARLSKPMAMAEALNAWLDSSKK